jgi:aminopeptidase YwaD
VFEAANRNDPFHVDRLRSDLEQIVGFGPRAREDIDAIRGTIEFLARELSTAGYKVELDHFGSTPADCNLIASSPSVDLRNGPGLLEIGAHFDTVKGSPGADDNASGLVGLLAVARYMSLHPESRVRFCAFGREESGMDGSRNHQRRLDRENADFFGAVIFEMIGYTSMEPGSQKTPIRIPGLMWPPRIGDFIALVANLSSWRVAKGCERASRQTGLRVYSMNKLIGGLLKDAARSDHLSYWRSRRAAIMLTDTANFRNPNYHSANDTIETVNYELISDVARATAAFACARLADASLTGDR